MIKDFDRGGTVFLLWIQVLFFNFRFDLCKFLFKISSFGEGLNGNIANLRDLLCHHIQHHRCLNFEGRKKLRFNKQNVILGLEPD